jgi:hypothetical protein
MKKLFIILAFLPLFGFGQKSLLGFNGGILSFNNALLSESRLDTVILIHMIGQDNISGGALISGLTGNLEKYAGEQDVFIFDSTNFNKINSDVNNNQFPVSQQNSHFGLELSLAYRLDSLLPGNIYINKYAIGSSYLYADPTLDWNAVSTEELYYRFKNMRSRALDKLSSCVVVEYVVWYQGEKDASSLTASNVYAANLNNFIDSVNTLTDSCKFYCVRIHEDMANIGYPYHDTIRSSQYSVFQNHYNTELVTVDDYSLQTDSIHLNVQGEIDLGEKLAVRIEQDFTPSVEAVNLYARFTNPTLNERTKIIHVFDSMNYKGLTDSTNILYFFKTNNETNANLNWMSSSFTGTPMNSPTFYSDSGYVFSSASSQYFNTNFNTSSDFDYPLKYMSMGIYSSAAIGSGLYADIGNSNGVQRNYITASYNGNMYGFLSTISISGANTSDVGLFSVRRDVIDEYIYRNTTEIASGILTDTVRINYDLYIGALSASQYSNRSYSFMWFGRFQNISGIYGIINQYLYDKLIF